VEEWYLEVVVVVLVVMHISWGIIDVVSLMRV
jgi:hypothetical protein